MPKFEGFPNNEENLDALYKIDKDPENEDLETEDIEKNPNEEADDDPPTHEIMDDEDKD